jgi:membrane-associated protease RseP (regulator of RpoE activity)
LLSQDDVRGLSGRLNPYEESDPNDRGSYANAGVWARIVVVAAGALANCLLASILVFLGLLIDGHRIVDAARTGLLAPPLFVRENLIAIAQWVAGKGHVALSGPVGIVKAAASQVRIGPGALLEFLGLLSASMGAFNLFPVPFLDGGRLLFLGVEAVSRRKPDAKVEARVHAGGLIVLMLFMAFATYKDVVLT